MALVRHKVFISYYHADQDEVDDFIETFDEDRDVFITRGLGLEMDPTIIDSDNTTYVMRRIRELYLKDSTVTLVMLGKCTWSRRYVDWEIQSSLRSGETVTPNGLLGIKLKSYRKGHGYPERLNLNLRDPDEDDECYARVINYPTRSDSLASRINDAFLSRTSRAHLINNPRDRFKYNRSCS